MNRYNRNRNYIPLYCDQPTQTEEQNDLSSEIELSDFPPIRERKSTPPVRVCPPVRVRSPVRVHPPVRIRPPVQVRPPPQAVLVSSEDEPPRSDSQRRPGPSRQPNTGLGQANIINMVASGAIIPVRTLYSFRVAMLIVNVNSRVFVLIQENHR